MYFKTQLHKKQNFGQKKKVWNKMFEILGHLPYLLLLFELRFYSLVNPLRSFQAYQFTYPHFPWVGLVL